MESNDKDKAIQPKGFREFLESSPPSTSPVLVANAYRTGGGNLHVSTPELELHCDVSCCDGTRTFRIHSAEIYIEFNNWKYGYLLYVCGNCKERTKRFALGLLCKGETTHAIKLGEIPAFGSPVPSRLISMVGPHRELFLKGRRAENIGLGIAAFAYYRRVVEREKGRIIAEIAKVAKTLGASEDTLKAFDAASKETQFTKAIDEIKHGIPQSILIEGHNPLTLLHSALSEGLHSETDEQCLELAQHIRVIMVELAERLGTALKEDQELKTAVTKLLSKRTQQKSEAKT